MAKFQVTVAKFQVTVAKFLVVVFVFAVRWCRCVEFGCGVLAAGTWTIEPILYKELQQDYPHDHIYYHGDLKEHRLIEEEQQNTVEGSCNFPKLYKIKQN